MKKQYLWLAVLLALVLALAPAVVGCGSSSSDDTETTEAQAASGDETATTEGMDTETTEDTAASTAPSNEEVDAAIQAVTKSDNIDTPPTVESGVLQGGSDTAFPPFEFADESGNYVGFDVDLMTAMAKKMGLELKVVSTAWDGIIPALVSSRYDIIMSAMTITDERKQQISFSDPYIKADIAITTPVDKPIETADGLSGKVVGVQIDTTGQFAAEDVQGVKEIKKYETVLNAFQDLYSGRIDAVVNDAPVNAYIIRDNPDFANTGTIQTGDVYGFGIKQENTQLREAINKALQEVKDEGLYDKIFMKWFGELPAEQQ